jgi:hypothetical protein
MRRRSSTISTAGQQIPATTATTTARALTGPLYHCTGTGVRRPS